MSTLVEKAEALAVEVSFSNDALSVTLSDGPVVSVPLVWFPRLADATPRERPDWDLIGGGIGIHWEEIDEDTSVESLLRPENFIRLPNEALQPASRAAGRGRAVSAQLAVELNSQLNPITSETIRRKNAMRLTTSLLLTVLLIAVGGHACVGDTSTTKGDPKNMTNQDRQDLQTLLDRYEGALNTSDVDAVIELYAADGVFMPSSAPTAVGIESVRAAYEHVFTTIKLNIAFTVEEIVADGSIAFCTHWLEGDGDRPRQRHVRS